MQRRIVRVVYSVNIGTFHNQDIGYISVPPFGGIVQWCALGIAPCIDIGTPVDEKFCGFDVSHKIERSAPIFVLDVYISTFFDECF